MWLLTQHANWFCVQNIQPGASAKPFDTAEEQRSYPVCGWTWRHLWKTFSLQEMYLVQGTSVLFFFNMCMLGHPCWVYAKSWLVNRATIVSYFDAFYFHKKVLPLLLCEIHEQWKTNTWLLQPECFNSSGYHFLKHLLHSPTASYNQQTVSLA